jgi:PEGA domain
MTRHLQVFVCLLAFMTLPLAFAQQTFNNDSVIRMIKMGFSEDTIVNAINHSPGAYDTSVDGLIALKTAGVGDKIVSAMVSKSSVVAPTPVVQTVPASEVPSAGPQANSRQTLAASSTPTRQAASSPERSLLPNTLMDGTPIKLRLDRTISSADEKVGNEVNFDVIEEIKVNDVVIIPKGSVATGTVTEADHKKSMGRAGKLDVNIDYVRMADGEKAALTATEGGKAGGHTGAMTGAIVATSIIFFPAAPLFLFIHGKDFVIPKGTEITAYINGDTRLTMAKFAPTEPISNPVSEAFAQVSIDSNISNCDVEVDGAFAGNTPSQLSLAAGTHKISVSQKGYVPWSRTVLVTSSGLHVRAQLDIAGAAPVAGSVVTTTAHQ